MNRVLLIDDHLPSREALQRHFSVLGFSVMGSNWSDARRALEAEPDYIVVRTTHQGIPVENFGHARAYLLRDSGPPASLCDDSRLNPQDNAAQFWHRRLLRALNDSALLTAAH